MEWLYFSIFFGLSFSMGLFFGLYFRPIKGNSRMATLKEKAKIKAFGKRKAYSPSADPNRLLDELEYSYFDVED